jgi:hypothetical protein
MLIVQGIGMGMKYGLTNPKFRPSISLQENASHPPFLAKKNLSQLFC